LFGNDPEGADAILQLRAAALCDDGRPPLHLPGRDGARPSRARMQRNAQAGFVSELYFDILWRQAAADELTAGLELIAEREAETR